MRNTVPNVAAGGGATAVVLFCRSFLLRPVDDDWPRDAALTCEAAPPGVGYTARCGVIGSSICPEAGGGGGPAPFPGPFSLSPASTSTQ